MTKQEWDEQLDECFRKEEIALRQLFLILAHEYAHPDCDDYDSRLDATFAVVEAWHEKMEHFDNEPKPAVPFLKLVT